MEEYERNKSRVLLPYLLRLLKLLNMKLRFKVKEVSAYDVSSAHERTVDSKDFTTFFFLPIFYAQGTKI